MIVTQDNVNTFLYLVNPLLPVIGIVIVLFIWKSSKFNARSICMQFTYISQLLLFCTLYLADRSQLESHIIVDVVLRILSISTLICISIHLYYVTEGYKKRAIRKRQNKAISNTT